jgi:hypothetical protein
LKKKAMVLPPDRICGRSEAAKTEKKPTPKCPTEFSSGFPVAISEIRSQLSARAGNRRF